MALHLGIIVIDCFVPRNDIELIYEENNADFGR